MASWERFLGAMSWLQFPSESASISLPNSHHFSHDRATIVVQIVRRSLSARMAAIPPRKLPDRGSIAPRWRFDQTAIVEFFHETSEPSDDASGEWTVRSRSSGIHF